MKAPFHNENCLTLLLHHVPKIIPAISFFKSLILHICFVYLKVFNIPASILWLQMNDSSSSILSANQSAVAQFWLEGVLTPAVSLAGVVGNTVCILVLTLKRGDLGLKPSFIDLLTMLVKHSLLL